ncbi:hypothetical protein [Nostoc sp. PCC 9305]
MPKTIPPNLFAEFVHKRNELVAKGVDIINMATGEPDKLHFSSHPSGDA